MRSRSVLVDRLKYRYDKVPPAEARERICSLLRIHSATTNSSILKFNQPRQKPAAEVASEAIVAIAGILGLDEFGIDILDERRHLVEDLASEDGSDQCIR